MGYYNELRRKTIERYQRWLEEALAETPQRPWWIDQLRRMIARETVLFHAIEQANAREEADAAEAMERAAETGTVTRIDHVLTAEERKALFDAGKGALDAMERR